MSLRRSRLAFLTVVAVLGFLAVPAGGSASTASTQLTVYAAASLTDVFPAIAPHEKYSFAGSNALATQIQQGAPADVFASANMTLPTSSSRTGCARSRSCSPATGS